MLFGLFCLLVWIGENPIGALCLLLVIVGILAFIIIKGSRDYKRITGRSVWK